MVESLRELNKLCQKPDYKTKGNWMVRKFLRDAALPVTWVLLHTPVTANQVTLAALVIGVAGIGLLAFAAPGYFFAGMLLIQLWYYLDHVDGQIARYRGTSSLTGRFFDFLMHHIVHGIFFAGLGFYCFLEYGSLFFVLLSFAVSVAIIMFNCTHDIAAKTYIEFLSKGGRFQVVSQQEKSANAATNRSGLRRIFSLLHKACEMHVLMNLFTLFSVLQFVMREKFDFRLVGFLVYGIIVPLVASVKFAFILKTQKIDSDYAVQFKAID